MYANVAMLKACPVGATNVWATPLLSDVLPPMRIAIIAQFLQSGYEENGKKF